MALPSFYNVGAASVSNGATTITFTGALLGTEESPAFVAGDLFMDPAQPLVPPQRIASIDYDAAEAELAVAWPGTSMTADPYEVRYIGDSVRSAAQNRRYLEMAGQLVALGIQPDAFGELVDRDAYDDAQGGFIFLSLEDPWTLYTKLTSDDADWSDGQPVEGPQGIHGETGLLAEWEGGWAPATAYEEFDAVRFNGSSYIALTAHTSGSDFIVDLGAGKWDLVAQSGGGPIWRGAWDSGTTYVVNDVVSDDDSGGDPAAWVALTTNLNSRPRDNPSDWDFFPASFPAVDDYGSFTDPVDATADYGVFH